jgi:mannosyltransferase OCH1-like enzyme
LISTYWLLLGHVMCAVYHQLKTAVEKSDAWRYHVLCGHGGIYTDTDTICAKPFEQWINFNTTPEPGLIVGIENRFYSQQEAEEASYVHKIQVLAFINLVKDSIFTVCHRLINQPLNPGPRPFTAVAMQCSCGGSFCSLA